MLTVIFHWVLLAVSLQNLGCSQKNKDLRFAPTIYIATIDSLRMLENLLTAWELSSCCVWHVAACNGYLLEQKLPLTESGDTLSCNSNSAARHRAQQAILSQNLQTVSARSISAGG